MGWLFPDRRSPINRMLDERSANRRAARAADRERARQSMSTRWHNAAQRDPLLHPERNPA